MRYIIDGGIKTKNVPLYSIDSVMLALNNPRIDGILVNVFETCDGRFIIYDNDNINGYLEINSSICDIKFDKLKNYNFGNKIKKSFIVSLEDLLNLFNGSSKLVVINISNSPKSNKQMVDDLSLILNRYDNINIYLKSSVKEIVLYSKNVISNCKIGANIVNDDDYFWNLDLDFYSINYDYINTNTLVNKLNDGKIVMFEKISNNYKNIIKKYFNYIYIIVKNIKNIVNNINF